MSRMQGGDPLDTELPTLPADMLGGNDMALDYGDDEMDISIVDEPLRGQNEDDHDGRSVDELGDETSSRLHDDIQRERQQRGESERKWLAQQEALEQQVIDAEKRSVRAQRDSFKLAIDGIDVRIATAREALKYARQEDDVGTQTDLEDHLRQLREMRSKIETNMGQLPEEAALDRAYQDHVAKRRQSAGAQASDDVQPLNDRAARWIKANPWMSDASKAPAKKSVREVDQALVAEGYDPNSDAYFVELSRRVAKRHPDIKVADLSGRGPGQSGTRPQAPGRQASSPPVASTRSVAPGAPNNKTRTRIELDGTDRSMMQRLGIDMSNKAAVQRYAKEKLLRLQRESRGV